QTLEPGSLSLRDGRIAALEDDPLAERAIDCSGCAVIPGFVDCHTHLPFAGWREGEYAMKVAGTPYEEIARAGGGIRASARALREASDAAVLEQAGALADEMLAHGTTALECKSGYGLSVEGELRALALAAQLGGRVRQATTNTALLAHAVPDGFDGESWMEAVAEMLPQVVAAGRVSALDIYVESVAFTNDDLRRMGELARRFGLDLRAHVEQFSTAHSVPVALEAGARSVDHLACLPAEDIPALAASQTAAVLLPGAEFLGREHVAPARELADAGAICVLGSDLNPGTSPVTSMPLIVGLAVRRYGWTVREALLGATLNAAWVLRLSGETGSLEAGKRADVLVLDGPIERIPYRFGHNPVALVFCAGELVHVRPDAAWRVRR
ncbi:MAG TPA: imidazolonepropionase, partial [Solirubrobacteraceae bacterium]|nr:imidazolonepropionase [Solirubrobacteraceae bacterium]